MKTLYPFEYSHCVQLLQNSTDNTAYLHLTFSRTCFQHNLNRTINGLSNYSPQLILFQNSLTCALHSSQLAAYDIGATPVQAKIWGNRMHNQPPRNTHGTTPSKPT
ncbi:DEHA2A06138p [Debaryomyces hansenii CBS767]|uniref:DEHA2A06138p n=1 Tax=Debaryomyces hansenii (strain ATCC 36239 / CBS 767 / BCRC 21394 / JCM 1990 / NBRC 0083 / IGC 2968) TaxID=284592 RepID=Q6BYX9_DEBHA|nr:DEHA2A06138p [Debaryomyces hansenii CBS767]CAG84546.2 DEHA2A06138p [Debaryomyces hansenii CBS767]|eukprot:XP_456590.2 DEHA2A06138p [Debaryomyces hansenii CBS767]